MIGYNLKTKQTTGDGVTVRKVMVAESLDISRETYFAIVLDRSMQGPVLVGSPEGGVDIEEVAASRPERIFKTPVDITVGVTDKQASEMAKNLEFTGPALEEAARQIKSLYRLFCGVDATQVEINPLGETSEGEVVCFDAKINFDDSAKFRQREIFAMEDTAESDPREVEAARYDLNYIGMTGDIGCLGIYTFQVVKQVTQHPLSLSLSLPPVNGAGLAMATMDIIKLHNGQPANFLDVGGGVNEKQVLNAFRIITNDPQVKAILVNIFGGIVDCTTIANGIVGACREIQLRMPLVVRLEGTNSVKARQILDESGLPIQAASDLADAANKVVASLHS
ncbi:Succinate--CoA ligase [GDP-forming] subunit beta, mitochondrial (Fragment) [Geodia barretti]